MRRELSLSFFSSVGNQITKLFDASLNFDLKVNEALVGNVKIRWQKRKQQTYTQKCAWNYS